MSKARKPNFWVHFHIPARSACAWNLYIACCVARSFGKRKVTPQMLIEKFDMSRATAYRWARAWEEANGVSP